MQFLFHWSSVDIMQFLLDSEISSPTNRHWFYCRYNAFFVTILTVLYSASWMEAFGYMLSGADVKLLQELRL